MALMRCVTSSSMLPRKARTSGLSLLVAVCVAALSSVSLDVGFAEAPAKIVRRALKPMRDPAKPKRPASPWLQFTMKYRQDNPGLGKECLTKASAAWKTADAATKRGLEEKYEAAKKTYQEELAAYKSSGREEAWLRPVGKPKRPLTPFLLYNMEQLKQGGASAEPSGFSFNPFGVGDSAADSGSISVAESAKRASAKWKGMSESEKAPYETQYAKAKAEYQAAMEKYKASGAQQEWEKKVGILAQKEKIAAKAARAKAKAKAEAAKARKAAAKAKVKAKSMA